MFNWIKGCIAIVLVSLSVQVFGQCIGCPPLSGGSVPVPQGSFNGQTSSVTTYNGATPTCYSPTSGGLNGHLQGINNSLCNLRGRLDSLALSGNDSLIAILQGEIDSVAGLIQYYNVISSDSSVIVTRDTVDGVIEFDLSVPQITVNVDATCLGIYTNDLDSILQALIDLNCDTNTYSFCGSPLWDFFSFNSFPNNNDTIMFNDGYGNPIFSFEDSLVISLQATSSGFPYPFFCQGATTCDDFWNNCYLEDSCFKIDNLSFLVNNNSFNTIDSLTCSESPQEYIGSFFYIYDPYLLDTIDLLSFASTISNDTFVKNDVCIPIGGELNTIYRILGAVYSDVSWTNSAISISAYPIKTSGQTYATNSFKIQKIAYADIDAPVIDEQVYNPNSGEQTKSLAITTGQNTFCVQVEDTDGNIAYTIFQLTKSL